MKRAAAALVLAAASFAAHAGRPLTTEDVATVEDKACQLEAWIDRSRANTRAWAVPACNFGWGIEWQAGFARAHDAGITSFSESYMQGKKVLLAPVEGGWGYGLVAGYARFPRRPAFRGWQDPYVIVPLTITPDAPTAIHVNAGWTRDRELGSDSMLWGVAGERSITQRIALVGEVFGTDRERPFVRLGTRVTATAGLDLDLTLVTRSGGTRNDRYVSLGLTWQSKPFLP